MRRKSPNPDILKELYLVEHWPASRIAHKYNCHTSSIVRQLHRAGIRARGPREMHQDLGKHLDIAFQLIDCFNRREGVTVYTLMEEFKIPRKTADRWLTIAERRLPLEVDGGNGVLTYYRMMRK